MCEFHPPAFLHIGLPVDDKHLIILEQHIAVVVAEMVGVAFGGAVEMGEVAEVEAS
ncbi:hypothetical protein [Pontibacter sp. SGAir0037]|uniref:hypothetical protein n=1 Tax=Pontibacter sp. SGAir0037 TaxID=2571030 RepID=UPI00143D00D3|nr:hypothetical protein [Pontibacter sp. SGAir0037]